MRKKASVYRVQKQDYHSSGDMLPFNTTEQVVGGNRITGSRDAIFLRNRYQTELDNSHTALVNEIHHTEGLNKRKTVDYYYNAVALNDDIISHLDELTSLESALESLLDKDFGQEFKMWKENTQGLNIKTKDGISGSVTSILGVASSSPAIKYLEKYPEQTSHPGVIANKNSLENKIQDIRKKHEEYHEQVSLFNHELPFYSKNVQKCKDNLNRFFSILDEGNAKINECRYLKSIFFRILPQDKKSDILLYTLPFPIEKWKHMIDLFDDDLNKYINSDFAYKE